MIACGAAVCCECLELVPEVAAVTPDETKLLPQPNDESVTALYPICVQLLLPNPAKLEMEKNDVVKLTALHKRVAHPDAPFLDADLAVDAAEIPADMALGIKLMIPCPVTVPTAPAAKASRPSTRSKSCPVTFALIHDVARLIPPPITAAAT